MLAWVIGALAMGTIVPSSSLRLTAFGFAPPLPDLVLARPDRQAEPVARSFEPRLRRNYWSILALNVVVVARPLGKIDSQQRPVSVSMSRTV